MSIEARENASSQILYHVTLLCIHALMYLIRIYHSSISPVSQRTLLSTLAVSVRTTAVTRPDALITRFVRLLRRHKLTVQGAYGRLHLNAVNPSVLSDDGSTTRRHAMSRTFA